MPVLKNNIAGLSTTAGTGSWAITSTYARSADWSTVTPGLEVSYYANFLDPDSDGDDFEQGVGIWNGSVITRVTIETGSSGAGSAHSFPAGTKLISLTANVGALSDMDNMVDGSVNLALLPVERTKIAASVRSFLDTTAGGIKLGAFTGQSNIVNQYAPTVPVTVNNYVFVWQPSDVSAQTGFAWIVADPNAATNYVNNQLIVGIRGNGIANIGWATMNRLQIESRTDPADYTTGDKCYLFEAAKNGTAIVEWETGGTLRAAINTQLTAALLDPLLSGISYPHFWVWGQGEANAVAVTPALEYRTSFYDFRTWVDTTFGGIGIAPWLFLQPGGGFFDSWEGVRAVSRFNDGFVAIIPTRAFSAGLDGLFHYNGDDTIRIGEICANRILYGVSTSDVGTSVLNNFFGTAPPAVTDDYISGYSIGSVWRYLTTFYDCTDATFTAAVWTARSVGGGSNNAHELVWSSGTQSEVADGASAVAFDRDTDNAFSTAGALLDKLSTNGVQKYYVDKDGLVLQDGLAQTVTLTAGTSSMIAHHNSDGRAERSNTHVKYQTAVTSGGSPGVVAIAIATVSGDTIHGTMEISGLRTDAGPTFAEDEDVFLMSVRFGQVARSGPTINMWNQAVLETTHSVITWAASGFLGYSLTVTPPASQTWEWRIKTEWHDLKEG